ncbi:hypothetical protein ACJX0J_009241, partial [Zea mays]
MGLTFILVVFKTGIDIGEWAFRLTIIKTTGSKTCLFFESILKHNSLPYIQKYYSSRSLLFVLILTIYSFLGCHDAHVEVQHHSLTVAVVHQTFYPTFPINIILKCIPRLQMGRVDYGTGLGQEPLNIMNMNECDEVFRYKFMYIIVER